MKKKQLVKAKKESTEPSVTSTLPVTIQAILMHRALYSKNDCYEYLIDFSLKPIREVVLPNFYLFHFYYPSRDENLTIVNSCTSNSGVLFILSS